MRIAPLLACSLAFSSFAVAKDGKVLIDETFSQPEIPSAWQPGGRPKSFSIVDGALRGVARPDDSHGPSIGVPIVARNLDIEFAVKFAKPGYFLFLVDGDSSFGGQAHLLRFALTPKIAQLAQDRGSLESKRAQAAQREAAQKAGTQPPRPTAEQLADAKFYRRESLAIKPAKAADGEWHKVRIEIRGNHVTATLDNLPRLEASATVLDVPKSRLVFLVGQSGEVLIDNVRASEAD